MNRLDATLQLSTLLSPSFHDMEILKRIMQTADWQELIKVANRYILVPALYATLKRKGLLLYIRDEQLLGYLQEVYRLNTLRNVAILEQLNEICELLQTINVKPVLLKGAAALSESHYETIGERAMMDIDILVPEEKVFEVIELLKDKDGYQELGGYGKLSLTWHHYHRLHKESGSASVEIHRYAVHTEEMKYFPKKLDDFYLIQSKSIQNASVIEPMYELYHSFLHSQLSHSYHKTKFIALRHLHHFSVMMQNYKDVNWSMMMQMCKEHGVEKTFNEYLYLVANIFKIQLPVYIGETKSQKQYLQKVYKRVENTNTSFLKLKVLFKRLGNIFSYTKLQSHYTFTNKALMFIYVPLRVIHLVYLYVTDSKKLKNLKKQVNLGAS
jgi:hypothetical protein